MLFIIIEKKLYVFYGFWTQTIILQEVIWHMASGDENFNLEKFQFHIIESHLTDPLQTWYDGKTT